MQLTSCFTPWTRTYQLTTGWWKQSVVIGLLTKSWISTLTQCTTFEFKHEMQKEWGLSLILSSSGLWKVWIISYYSSGFLFLWDCCKILMVSVLGTIFAFSVGNMTTMDIQIKMYCFMLKANMSEKDLLCYHIFCLQYKAGIFNLIFFFAFTILLEFCIDFMCIGSIQNILRLFSLFM